MIAAILPLGSLPAGLRFDGIMPGKDRNYLQFTELDMGSPSFGASFYVDSGTALMEAVLARREEKRLQFSAAPPASSEPSAF